MYKINKKGGNHEIKELTPRYSITTPPLTSEPLTPIPDQGGFPDLPGFEGFLGPEFKTRGGFAVGGPKP